MRRTPIRTRLTAWYALVLAAVLLGLGAFVVTRLGADLTAELDRSLRASADQIALGYHAEGPAEFRDVTRTVLPVPGERGAGAQVLARGGRVVLAEGDPLTRAPLLEAPALARVLAGGRVTVSRRLGRPARAVRITAVPVRRDGVVLALATTESLAAVDSARHRVLVLLLVGGTARADARDAGRVDDRAARHATRRAHDEPGRRGRPQRSAPADRRPARRGRGRPPGADAQRDARPARGRRRGTGAPRRRRLARAAHPAGRHAVRA